MIENIANNGSFGVVEQAAVHEVAAGNVRYSSEDYATLADMVFSTICDIRDKYGRVPQTSTVVNGVGRELGLSADEKTLCMGVVNHLYGEKIDLMRRAEENARRYNLGK